MQSITEAIAALSPAKQALLLQSLLRPDRSPAPEQPRPREKKNGVYPLSFGQQRLWFLQRLAPESAAYNYPAVVRLDGRLNVKALTDSLSEILRRHDVLRARFVDQRGEPFQVIRPPEPAQLQLMDLSELPEERRVERAMELAAEEAHRPFDLQRDLLWRSVLLRLNETRHWLVVITHHIVFDGWSLGIFLQEFSSIYQSLSQNRRPSLKDLEFKYTDYALWQRERLQGESFEKSLAYWLARLKGASDVLRLPADRPRPSKQTFRGAQQALALHPQLGNRLKDLSRREGVTLFMTLLAAFKTLLYSYTRQPEIVVGTDTANRPLVETEPLIGFFVNILVLRTDLSGNPSFLELLGRVREVSLQAFDHEGLPFEKLVETLRPERAPGYTPLVQALFLLQNVALTGPQIPGLTLALQEIKRETAKFDLVVSVAETQEGLGWAFNYSTDLFNAETIERMMNRFRRLLEEIVARPHARLKDLTRFISDERIQPMIQGVRQPKKFSRLGEIRRKPVDVTSEDLVLTGRLQEDDTLPLLISPVAPDVDLTEWAGGNHELLEKRLSEHGAILFRGFRVDSPAEFEAVATAVCGKLFGEYQDLPRETQGQNIYGSTPYPHDQTILFHNESSHLCQWPMKQWFFCVTAAKQGGETPLVDCRKVYRLLDQALVLEFEKKKLRYVRNFIEGLDVSWQDFFKTAERDVVEARCREADLEFEWKGDNGLKVSRVCPAVMRHPKTGEMTFFNQVQLHHISTLAPTVRQSMVSLFREDDLPRNVYYGDGTPIEDAVISEITDLYWKIAVSFPWREGDIILLDNMLTAHARNPYLGPRKILVTMGEMMSHPAASC